jgi:HAD superfamily hydrolase (TIGR01549 family)
MALIIDLDQTLVDSSIAEPLRNQGRWNEVYQLIPIMKPYKNITETLSLLNSNDIKIAVVTSAPRTYCEKVISQWGWKIDTTVCYHDTQNKKPSPEPLLLAIKNLKVHKTEVVSAGDRDIDIQASKAAGVFSLGCGWGCKEIEMLKASTPDKLITTVEEFQRFLIDRYFLNGH